MCQPSNSAMGTAEIEAGYKTKRERRGGNGGAGRQHRILGQVHSV